MEVIHTSPLSKTWTCLKKSQTWRPGGMNERWPPSGEITNSRLLYVLAQTSPELVTNTSRRSWVNEVGTPFQPASVRCISSAPSPTAQTSFSARPWTALRIPAAGRVSPLQTELRRPQISAAPVEELPPTAHAVPPRIPQTPLKETP